MTICNCVAQDQANITFYLTILTSRIHLSQISIHPSSVLAYSCPQGHGGQLLLAVMGRRQSYILDKLPIYHRATWKDKISTQGPQAWDQTYDPQTKWVQPMNRSTLTHVFDFTIHVHVGTSVWIRFSSTIGASLPPCNKFLQAFQSLWTAATDSSISENANYFGNIPAMRNSLDVGFQDGSEFQAWIGN